MEKTTTQINPETLERLNDKEVADIQKALEDIKKGKAYSIEAVAKEFRVALR